MSEEGAERPQTPKPIHLWSSPIVEKSSSQSSLNRRAKRLELSTLDDNSQDDKNGWISEKGKLLKKKQISNRDFYLHGILLLARLLCNWY